MAKNLRHPKVREIVANIHKFSQTNPSPYPVPSLESIVPGIRLALYLLSSDPVTGKNEERMVEEQIALTPVLFDHLGLYFDALVSQNGDPWHRRRIYLHHQGIVPALSWADYEPKCWQADYRVTVLGSTPRSKLCTLVLRQQWQEIKRFFER